MLKKDQLDRLFEALANGMTIKDSCALAEMSEGAYYKKYKLEPKFKVKVEQVQSDRKERLVKIIQEAAKKGKQKSWVASAWLLERKHPDEYGQKQKVEHEGGVLKQIIIVQGPKEDRLGKRLEQGTEQKAEADKS